MKTSLFKVFADLRFTISILLIIACSSIIGTIIEQDQSIETYKLNYPLTNKILGFISWDTILKFGLDHIYKTWWFYILVGLSLILGSWKIIDYFYTRKLKIQSFKRELLQLESKALQSQMNQHFVFNSLNSIQSFITNGNILSSGIYLAKFSKLLRKILNNSSEAACSLSKEIEYLENQDWVQN